MGNGGSTLPPRGPKCRRRDMVHHGRQQLLYDLIVPWVTSAYCVLGSGPSILVKSPQEHDEDAINARHKMSYMMKHHYTKPPTPIGHVRIHFYMPQEFTQRAERKPNLVSDIPLEPGGELDLRRIKSLWGLESCAPIDPLRWKVVETNQDRLSPLAVHILSQGNQAIKVIEPQVSESTRRKRAIRQIIIPIFIWLCSFYQLMLYRGENVIRQHTSIMTWHQQAVEQRRRLSWRVERWMFEHDELIRMLNALLMLAVIVLIVSVMGGYVDLGFKDCAMGWIEKLSGAVLS